MQSSIRQPCKYKVYAEFQSHEPEFDYLKSLEIEEKINQITFCRPVNGAIFLLSTNGALHEQVLLRMLRTPHPRREWLCRPSRLFRSHKLVNCVFRRQNDQIVEGLK